MKSSAVVVIFWLSMELTFWHKKNCSKMKIWNCEPKKGVDLWIHLHILLLFNGVTAATIQQVIKKFFRVQQKQPKECLSSFFSNTFFNFLLHICRAPKNLFTYLNSLIPFKITSYDVEVEYFEILLSLSNGTFSAAEFR